MLCDQLTVRYVRSFERDLPNVEHRLSIMSGTFAEQSEQAKERDHFLSTQPFES